MGDGEHLKKCIHQFLVKVFAADTRETLSWGLSRQRKFECLLDSQGWNMDVI